MAAGALPGFRDFYPDTFAQRAQIVHAWRTVARRFGFVEYDGPPLEPLELYTRKSGEEIVGQLYNFVDKGGREVALRPEMTPTFARMVAARANALRKPVRWFSVPQLFRYERQQKGRLREHFQLNVDIVGEPDALADAELLAVAIEIMRELGLTAADVRARVSDRRLFTALLGAVGVAGAQLPAAYAVVDKMTRLTHDDALRKLEDAGIAPATARRIVEVVHLPSLAELPDELAREPVVAESVARLGEYLAHLDALGVGDWVDLDLKIVRGLAYYTGTVFELFDARGELRAVAGGGRYDTLLAALGGVDLPALGFGMGDVVLGELLRDRGLLRAAPPASDYWVVADEGAALRDVLRAARALRQRGLSVEYPLNAAKLATQKTRAQLQAAQKAGAARALVVRRDGTGEIRTLGDDAAEPTVVRLDELAAPGAAGDPAAAAPPLS
ncbi:MAG TPA: histidine--tRNA ligase [Gemmatimonadaceae bacterium]|nr:histidine--tRNA ligase [Gemmatimonadaceae bacterium]